MYSMNLGWEVCLFEKFLTKFLILLFPYWLDNKVGLLHLNFLNRVTSVHPFAYGRLFEVHYWEWRGGTHFCLTPGLEEAPPCLEARQTYD